MVDGSNPSRPTIQVTGNAMFSSNQASFHAGFFMLVVHWLSSKSQETTTKDPCRSHFSGGCDCPLSVTLDTALPSNTPSNSLNGMATN